MKKTIDDKIENVVHIIPDSQCKYYDMAKAVEFDIGYEDCRECKGYDPACGFYKVKEEIKNE